MFQELNLPRFGVQLRLGDEGQTFVYDLLRQKWVVLTPEEWVRQHFVNYLTVHRGFPSTMMANEVGLRLNGTQRRCDTVIYTRSLRPLCIVEYKRPSVEITRTVFDQIARYNSVLGSPYLSVSNGMRHFCCRFNGDGYEFLREIPTYEDMILKAAEDES